MNQTPEELEKLSKSIKALQSKYSSIPWTTHYHLPENTEKVIPLEQDENGVYGYKVLVKYGSEWLISPNPAFRKSWVNDKLSADYIPTIDNTNGIYCTKSLAELDGWLEEYKAVYFRYSLPYKLFSVKLRVWGVIAEHSKGFRAQHAQIEGILYEHW